jgi:hypothetical protein
MRQGSRVTGQGSRGGGRALAIGSCIRSSRWRLLHASLRYPDTVESDGKNRPQPIARPPQAKIPRESVGQPAPIVVEDSFALTRCYVGVNAAAPVDQPIVIPGDRHSQTADPPDRHRRDRVNRVQLTVMADHQTSICGPLRKPPGRQAPVHRRPRTSRPSYRLGPPSRATTHVNSSPGRSRVVHV